MPLARAICPACGVDGSVASVGKLNVPLAFNTADLALLVSLSGAEPVMVILPSASLAVVIPPAPLILTTLPAEISTCVESSAAIDHEYVPARLGLSVRSL